MNLSNAYEASRVYGRRGDWDWWCGEPFAGNYWLLANAGTSAPLLYVNTGLIEELRCLPEC